MTKQEWIKRIEILMLTGRDCFGVCEEYNCTDCQDKAKEVYEGIVQDLLGEFVEWYKQMLIKDHDDKAWMMNHTEEQEIEDRYYYRGQCHAINGLIFSLDNDFEKFLETNEDDDGAEIRRTI